MAINNINGMLYPYIRNIKILKRYVSQNWWVYDYALVENYCSQWGVNVKASQSIYSLAD